MVEPVRKTETSGGEAPRGPSQTTLKKFLNAGFETVAKGFLKQYVGEDTAEKLTGLTSTFVSKALEGFSPTATRGEPLKSEAGTFAQNFFDTFLKGIAGDPPELGKGVSKNNQYLKYANIVEADGGWKLANKSHLLSFALSKLGIPEVFSQEIFNAIDRAKADTSIGSLTEPQKGENLGGWLKTIRHLFAGILREKDADSKLAKLLGAIPIEELVPVKQTQTTEAKDTVDTGPKPTSEMNDTTVSSTTPRGSNFAAFYISERAYSAKAPVKADTAKTEAVGQLVNHIIGDILKVEGAPAEKVSELTKDIERALQPLERKSKVDQLGVIQEVLKLLMADSLAAERTTKTLRSSVGRLEQQKKQLEADVAKPENAENQELKDKLAAATADLTKAQKDLKLAEDSVGRQATWTNLSTYFATFARLGVGDAKLDKGLETALNTGMAFVLEKLVAQKLGAEIPGDSMTAVLKKYSYILQNVRDNGAISQRARDKFKDARPNDVFSPMIGDFDPNMVPGRMDPQMLALMRPIVGLARELRQAEDSKKGEAAEKLANALMARMPDKSKAPDVAKVLQDIFGKATTNLDLVNACITEIKARTQLTEKDLGLDEYLQVEAGLKQAREEIASAETQVKNLDSGIENLTKLIKGLDPDGSITRLDAEKSNREAINGKIEALDGKIAEAGADIKKKEERLAGGKVRRPEKLREEIEGLKKHKAKLEADKAPLTKRLGEINTKITELESRAATANADPKAVQYFEAKWELDRLKAKLEVLKKEEPVEQAKVDKLTAKIAEQEPKVAALKTPEGEALAEKRAKLRTNIRERQLMGEQRAQFKEGIDKLEFKLRAMEGQTHGAAVELMQVLGAAVAQGEEIKKEFEKQKTEREKADKKDPAKPAADDPSNPSSKSGITPAQRRKNALVQERIRMCDAILSDPSLSTQDKILLFILTYAEYKKREQEDDLRDFNKQEERRSKWQEDREEMERKIKGQEGVVQDLQPKVDALKGEVAKLEKGPEKGGPLHAQKVQELKDLNGSLESARNEIKIQSEQLANHDTAPEAKADREMKLMLIERSMQEYDHLLRMADSLLQRYDRLVDQILRSMGQ